MAFTPLVRACPIRIISVQLLDAAGQLLRLLLLDREGHISAELHYVPREQALILASNRHWVLGPRPGFRFSVPTEPFPDGSAGWNLPEPRSRFRLAKGLGVQRECLPADPHLHRSFRTSVAAALPHLAGAETCAGGLRIHCRHRHLQVPPAPAGDGGLRVLEMPLQRPSALGAAPPAVVLTRGEYPPQP